MRWFCAVLLLFLAVADQSLVSGQLNIGSPCPVKNHTGYCELLPQCKPVYDELAKRIRPEFICGYQGTLPIVCCPYTIGDHNGTPRPIQPLTEPATTMRRAEQKCHEYAKMAQDAVLSGGFLNKLMGGTLAKVHEFPHMTAIGFVKDNKISWNCGGSLISELWILSASHCTFNHYWY